MDLKALANPEQNGALQNFHIPTKLAVDSNELNQVMNNFFPQRIPIFLPVIHGESGTFSSLTSIPKTADTASQVLENVKVAVENGADGVLVINHSERQFMVDQYDLNIRAQLEIPY